MLAPGILCDWAKVRTCAAGRVPGGVVFTLDVVEVLLLTRLPVALGVLVPWAVTAAAFWPAVAPDWVWEVVLVPWAVSALTIWLELAPAWACVVVLVPWAELAFTVWPVLTPAWVCVGVGVP